MERTIQLKKIQFCRSIENGLPKIKIYDSGLINFTNVYLKCELSKDEQRKIFVNQDDFVERTLASWRNSFYKMIIQSMYLSDHEDPGCLVVAIGNDQEIDKIDAQRIDKWGEDFIKVLEKYRGNEPEVADSDFESEIILENPEVNPDLIEEEFVNEVLFESESSEVQEESFESEASQEATSETPEPEAEVAPPEEEATEQSAPTYHLDIEIPTVDFPDKESSDTPLQTDESDLKTENTKSEPEKNGNLIPEIQGELSQLLSELDDLKASIAEVKDQTESLPKEENEMNDTDYPTQEEVATFSDPDSDVDLDYFEENQSKITRFDPETDSIQDSNKIDFRAEEVMKEVTNMEQYADEQKHYRHKNKRKINKISSKVLSAHMQSGVVKVSYKDLSHKIKNIEFISYLWDHVKLIPEDRNPMFYRDCDLEMLVEDALDFYHEEIQEQMSVKRPKFSRKVQVPNPFYMLVETYNELEEYLEGLLKENVNNQEVLDRIASK